MEKDNRMIQFDILRILAAFSVVMLHCSAQYWYSLDVTQTSWKIANAYDSISRFGVPVFVMISGALFLGRDKGTSLKRLYTHNILRLVILWGVWKVIYGLRYCYLSGVYKLGVKEIVKQCLSGGYHLWFLPMIIGLYAVSPILRTWIDAAREQEIRYLIYLFAGFQILRTTLCNILVNPELLGVLDSYEIAMVCGYLGYYVLGYYLVKYPLKQSLRKALYLALLPCMAANLFISQWQSAGKGIPDGDIYDSFGIFTFLIVIAVFVGVCQFCRDRKFKKSTQMVIGECSKGTLGIYLMHLILLDLLKTAGLDTMTLPIWIGIPLVALICFAGSLAVAALVRRIPVIGRYLC